MSPEVVRELRHLLSGLCDGTLTEAQHARLEQLLDADAEHRRLYLQYLDVHARLLLHPVFGSAGSPLPEEEPFLASLAEPAPAPPSSATPSGGGRRRRGGLAVRYALVAATSLAASLLIQFFWWRPGPGSPKWGEGPLTGSVATLSQAADCAWDNMPQPPPAGARLMPGDLHLRKGVARIHFDAGAELLLEGPAELHLDSDAAAMLKSGKAVFRADETGTPFDLSTPSATLDLGTEYAVAVDAEGEEVHVIEGDVERLPHADGAPPEYLKAGEARRCRRKPGFPSEPTRFEAARFVRRMPSPGLLPADLAAGLLAYEGFDYRDADALQAGKANGGAGWAGPWTVTVAPPPEKGDRSRLPLNITDSLSRPRPTVPPAGGRFEASGFAVYYRRLAVPLRMDTNGVYYISYLFRREGPPAHPMSTVALMLRPDEGPPAPGRGPAWPNLSNRLMIGVGPSNQVFTHLGRHSARACMPLGSRTTYLLVAKLVAGGAAPKQVFVRVYGPGEPVTGDEPGSWTVVSPQFRSDLVFQWLGLHVNSMSREMVDEIRVGSTWASVAGPWAAAPAPARP
jgi:ferric-dicitrate binding protein FerR (iron transport regulator)